MHQLMSDTVMMFQMHKGNGFRRGRWYTWLKIGNLRSWIRSTYILIYFLMTYSIKRNHNVILLYVILNVLEDIFFLLVILFLYFIAMFLFYFISIILNSSFINTYTIFLLVIFNAISNKYFLIVFLFFIRYWGWI